MADKVPDVTLSKFRSLFRSCALVVLYLPLIFLIASWQKQGGKSL